MQLLHVLVLLACVHEHTSEVCQRTCPAAAGAKLLSDLAIQRALSQLPLLVSCDLSHTGISKSCLKHLAKVRCCWGCVCCCVAGDCLQPVVGHYGPREDACSDMPTWTHDMSKA